MAAEPARVLVSAAALVFGSLAVATQMVAAHFHYPLQFGAGLVEIARQRIYAPWSLLVWDARYEPNRPMRSPARPWRASR